jgi:hypothetical protein
MLSILRTSSHKAKGRCSEAECQPFAFKAVLVRIGSLACAKRFTQLSNAKMYHRPYHNILARARGLID